MQTWAPVAAEDFDPAKPTYVLCKAGVRSMRAAMVLIDQGFTDVRNVSGGGGGGASSCWAFLSQQKKNRSR